MEVEGIDVLLAQANNDFMGGYVKYLTDLPATNGYVTTVVFPRDEPMTIIGQALLAWTSACHPEGTGFGAEWPASWARRATRQPTTARAMTPNLPKRRSSGLPPAPSGCSERRLSPSQLSTASGAATCGARGSSTSEVVDPIKAVKSVDEIEFVRRTSAAQDEAMGAALATVRPGMRELEVAAIAEKVGHSFGSEQGLFLGCSGPAGQPGQIVNRHLQHRVLQPSDQFNLLIENNGPGGFYCELGRSVVLARRRWR